MQIRKHSVPASGHITVPGVGAALAPVFIAIAVLLAGCVLRGETKSAQPPIANRAEIDMFLNTAWDGLERASGMAVAVYTPEGVYVRGLGVTDIETREPVTPDTAFYIASTTKAVTAMAVTALRRRGQIDLEATLSEYSPDAPFPPAVRPNEVRIKDLLTHTSGIDNRPIIVRSAFTGEHTPDLLWNLLGASQVNQSAPLGMFDYTNGGYNMLTILTDRRLGASWRDLLDKEIFRPAGMSRTTAYLSKAEREGWSIAQPHMTRSFAQPERIKLRKTDSMMQSAGGLIMSANDALTWLELLVNDGRVKDKQIVPQEVVQETRLPLARVGETRGSFTRESYGLGWFIGKHGGETVVHHSGGFSGYTAFISYMPERRVGVAIFINDSMVGPIYSERIASFIYGRLLGHNIEVGPVAAGEAALARYRTILILQSAEADRRKKRPWTLTRPRSAYVGTYNSVQTGSIVVSLQGENLQVQFGPQIAIAEPFVRPDSIRVELAPPSGDVIEFEVSQRGQVTAATFEGIRFERS